MRWIWIDKFVEFECGRRAVAIKNVSLAEEHLHDHFPGYPVMPQSLITEGCAQTGGLLVCEAINFRRMVILAKVSRGEYLGLAVPGDQLRYTVVLDNLGEDGAVTSVTVHNGDKLMARLEIMFGFVDAESAGPSAAGLKPRDFVAMLKILGVLDLPSMKRIRDLTA